MNDNAVLTPPSTTQDATETAATNGFPRRREHTIYKPNSRGTGAAIRFSLNRDKAAMFLEAAPQTGDRQFDWENKVIMKWGLSDIGGALAVLQGRQSSAKLFHQTEKGNSTFEMTTREDPERAPYMLALSRQNAASREVRKAALPLTHGEAAVLEAALRGAVTRLIGW
jgi:hypothetical protein